jgi:capsular polysaccharide biosynthesis protein
VKRPDLGDGWYESEEPTRLGMVTELQRIRRRTSVYPIPIILIAALITAGITYKIATKPRIYEADVVLALSEGAMTRQHKASGIPFGELKGYVSSVLMPDAKLMELIEKRNLHRLRKKFGDQYALTELREQVEITIWKNSFAYFDAEDTWAAKSARIGITVLEGDPDLAYDIAHDLASIVIQSHEEQRMKVSEGLARDVKAMRKALYERLDPIRDAIAQKQSEERAARAAGNYALVAALEVDLSTLVAERKNITTQLETIAHSPDSIADQVTKAGLDTTLTVVEERRPERHEQSTFVLIIVVVVVGTGVLIGTAVFLGAFDSRIHDTDDVSRLGLPVLGHVPGFPGDAVGSLGARGAVRRRVPSFLRWR